MSQKRKVKILLIVLLLACAYIFTSTALAATTDGVKKVLDSQVATAENAPSLFSNVVKLMLVLGIIVAAAWAIIQLFSKQLNRRIQGSWLHVVDEVMIGQNRGIVLVDIGEKIYALGVSDHGINLLFEVDNPKLLEEISQGNYRFQQAGKQSLLNGTNKEGKGWLKRSKKENKNSFHRQMQEENRKMSQIDFERIINNGSGVKKNDNDEKS